LISWIVASHDPGILHADLLATLQLEDGDELIVIADAPSITNAYNRGQAKATCPVRCYIHHDIQVLDNARLRAQLLEHCTPAVGLVGLAGSRTPKLPWWQGERCGSVLDARHGLLAFDVGGEAAHLDGMLLATTHHIDWDETLPGWHGYDTDACQQMLARGLTNWCLDDSHELVNHNTRGATNTGHLPHYHDNLARLRAKWGMP
jgi:hypothetical protein